jgi:hypothetical protein
MRRPERAAHLAEALREVGEKDHREVRGRRAEGPVRQCERLPVHDLCSRVATKACFREPLPQALDHRRREVHREHLGACPRRLQRKRACPGANVEHACSSSDAGQAQRLEGEEACAGFEGPLVGGADRVPARGLLIGTKFRRGGLLLDWHQLPSACPAAR